MTFTSSLCVIFLGAFLPATVTAQPKNNSIQTKVKQLSFTTYTQILTRGSGLLCFNESRQIYEAHKKEETKLYL